MDRPPPCSTRSATLFPYTTLFRSLGGARAFATKPSPVGTAIAPIYTRPAEDYAQTVAFTHEVSDGRFRFGIGISHAPSLARMGLQAGKPLADTRAFVERLRKVERIGKLPPVIMAALRRKMIALAGEIGAGMVFAQGARSHLAETPAGPAAANRGAGGCFIRC